MTYKPRFRELTRRFQELGEIRQPVPDVSEEDVIRVVQRDFPTEQFELVVSVLNEYRTENWEGGQIRVRVAALKLAKGDLDKLKPAIETAKRDYRDVLSVSTIFSYVGRHARERAISQREAADLQ